jgi:DUF4097 and DUF4098 domain-containing protein YvlB
MNRITIFWACLAAAWSTQAAFADEWNKQYSISGTADLHIDTNDGAVFVRAWDRKEVDVHVTTVGWRISSSDVQIHERQMGDRVELEVKLPRFNISIGRRSVRIDVQAPRELRADIRTGDGNITLTGLKGDIRLNTGDGGIEAEALDGALDATTGDGKMRVRGRFDVLRLHTGDGSIEAELAPGSKVASEWRIRTGDGHVTLRIPDGFGAEIDAHTGDGSITSYVAVTATGSFRDHELRGKLNGGGAPLVIRTDDGSIRLERW